MSQDNIEYEAKILDINVDSIVKKLHEVGAIEGRTYMFRRYVFDTIPAVKGRWVRLRSDGTTATLTVKEIRDSTIDGTHEWEVEVSDIATCLTILEKIGIQPKGYQENRRVEYTLGGVELSIDYWPHLSPYLEIEGDSEADVVRVAGLLGFTQDKLTSRNTESLYADAGIILDSVPELKFVDKA